MSHPAAPSGSLAVRAAGRTETAAVARVLARSFADDPVQRFLFPADALYDTRGLANFEMLVRRTHAVGIVEVTEGLEGAALWLRPGADFLDGPSGALFAIRSMWNSRANLGRLRALLGALAAHHPRERHWYLPVLGTEPSRQGRGVGSALLAHALARADSDALPAYLESSKAKNLPFYLRHGFEVIAHIAIPNGPEIWPMLRKPRPPTLRSD